MMDFINALPGAVSQGLIWGIMAIGVYITYKILDVADLTVDGSFCTGAAVFVMLFTNGSNMAAALLAAVLAGMAAGLVTGLLHTLCGIPAILAGILTQLGLWSVNLAIMDMKATVAINVTTPEMLDKLLVSLRFVQDVAKGTRPFYRHPIFVVGIFTIAIILLLYWFFGTELGCALRATGSNANMARAQGINTDFTKVLGLIIGEVGFSKVFHNFGLKLLAVSIGAILYYIVIQAVLAMGLNANYLKLLSACVVGLFLAIPYWKGKYSRPRVKIPAQTADKSKGGNHNA